MLPAEYVEQYARIYAKNANYRMKAFRQAAYTLWLKSQGDVKEHTLLDIGCGRGESIGIAQKLGIVATGVEIVAALCETESIHLCPRGAVELPFDDDSYDFVTAIDVLEHLEMADVDLAISEMWRVCKDSMLIGVPHKQDSMGLHLTVEPWSWWANHIVVFTGEHPTTLDFPIPAIKMPYSFMSVSRK